MEFSRNDIHKLIFYCWKRGLSTSEMTAEINETLGNSAVTQRTCQRWISNFNNDNFVFDDKKRSGRPSLNIDEEIVQCLDVDKRATSRLIAAEINQSQKTVWRHLVNMGKRYLENFWIPHKLTDANKFN